MTLNKPLKKILYFLSFSLISCLLMACQIGVTSGKTMTFSGSTNPSLLSSDNKSSVPKTGQKKKYMETDDGDLMVGKPWPEPRFIENNDGTVIDNLTGLMWTRNAGKATDKADWEQAISGASGCKEGGYNDWRLPNRNELVSLIDLGRYNPALPKNNPFTNVQLSYYWTSTTSSNDDDHAWLVHFYTGAIAHDDKAGTHYVWYVRGGQ